MKALVGWLLLPAMLLRGVTRGFREIGENIFEEWHSDEPDGLPRISSLPILPPKSALKPDSHDVVEDQP